MLHLYYCKSHFSLNKQPLNLRSVADWQMEALAFSLLGHSINVNPYRRLRFLHQQWRQQ
jgi:hypothetical protein